METTDTMIIFNDQCYATVSFNRHFSLEYQKSSVAQIVYPPETNNAPCLGTSVIYTYNMAMKDLFKNRMTRVKCRNLVI